MNRKLITRLFIIFTIASLRLGVPLSASAHGDEATIDLNVTHAQPGMTIEVRGSGFEPGDITTIMLVSNDRPQVLGNITADDHGDLAQVVALPADLTDGAYEVRVADSHHVAIAELDVVTDASGEEGGQRGEDEPLLAPMPTPGAGTGRASAAPFVNTAASLPTTEAELPIPTTLLVSSALAIIILVAGLVIILRRFR